MLVLLPVRLVLIVQKMGSVRHGVLLDSQRQESGRLIPPGIWIYSASYLTLPLLLLTCVLFEACGAYFVGFVSNPGGLQTISGTVSVVQLSSVRDITGETILLTAVTFLNPGAATTINFCGDQQTKFPLDRQVRADFTTGVVCSTLSAVVVTT